MWERVRVTSAAVAVMLCGAPAALGQGEEGASASEARTAAELLERLRAAGVDLGDVEAQANADGSVTVAPPPPPAPEPDVVWDNRITVGFGLSEGNTVRSNVNAQWRSARESDTSRLTLGAGYFYATDESETSENRASAGFVHDWLFEESRWLLFADGRYDYDQFQTWDHRVAGHGGVGYHLADTDDLDITLRAGAGAAKEFGGPDDDIRPEGVLGADLDWRITSRQTLAGSTRYYPSFDDTSEFRTLSSLDYSIQIDQMDGMSISFGVIHEYQSDVAPEDEEHDVRVYGGLTLDF